jgi:hypothetical protein
MIQYICPDIKTTITRFSVSSAAYDFDEFIKSCSKKPPNTYILRPAVVTAKTDFNLKTQVQVLEFIGNDGLENPYLLNVKQWENNPDPKIEIKVDAYGFYSGEQHGYIAFFFNQLQGNGLLNRLRIIYYLIQETSYFVMH